MQFIENLLEKELEDKDLEISKDLRIHFLKLKCKFEPESIVRILKLYNFPLTESLRVCRDLKLKHAVAHINFRLGFTEEAVDEYLSVSASWPEADFPDYQGVSEELPHACALPRGVEASHLRCSIQLQNSHRDIGVDDQK